MYNSLRQGIAWLSADDTWREPLLLIRRIRDFLGHNGFISALLSGLTRVLLSILSDLKIGCRPTSFYIPLGSAILGLILTFRAMETNSIRLPSTQEYETTCPENSRRTQSAVLVNLFAATITTICIQGHARSLAAADALSWRREIYRILETLISPLIFVVSFWEMAWYGFIDLLAITPGTWRNNITLRYRIARFCHSYLDADGIPRLHLQFVNPEHIKHVSLRRDLKWFGRLVILIVLSMQYVHTGLLLTRRILSDTAATIDYAMSFLVLSGLLGLFRCLMISLAHSAWRLDPDILPCVEKECRLPGCRTFKEDQGFPNTASLTIHGYNFIAIPRIVLNWLAAGYAQLAILTHDRRGILMNIYILFGLQAMWRFTIYAIVLWSGISSSSGDDRKPEGESMQACATVDDTLPAPASPKAQEMIRPGTHSNLMWTALFRLTFFSFGCILAALALLLFITQLSYIFGPCVMIYVMIASETTGWRNINATTPCLQLWKDPLEDELWWF